MKTVTAERYHDISTGHRVVGHENKCRYLHGHNYRIHFVCEAAELDTVGRVIDFGVIKEKLCMWVENYWDHKFLAWEKDPVMNAVSCVDFTGLDPAVRAEEDAMLQASLVFTPFNPTAENLAQYLVMVVAPEQLKGTGIELISCRIEETRKCTASFHLEQ